MKNEIFKAVENAKMAFDKLTDAINDYHEYPKCWIENGESVSITWNDPVVKGKYTECLGWLNSTVVFIIRKRKRTSIDKEFSEVIYVPTKYIAEYGDLYNLDGLKNNAQEMLTKIFMKV